jgi:hypothetical protein
LLWSMSPLGTMKGVSPSVVNRASIAVSGAS